MENKENNPITKTHADIHCEPQESKKDHSIAASILISVLIVSLTWVYTSGLKAEGNTGATQTSQRNEPTTDVLGEAVTPSAGVVLPVRWGDLGKRMVAAGVIDETQFKALYAQQGGLDVPTQSLLDASDNGNPIITSKNSAAILNMLWALGLGNKNSILEQGPMQDPRYGGAGRFASTGGWTIAVGDPMRHYSAHPFVVLTPDQQLLVEKVAKGIYRPCCGNSTYFPDCNHGMAMLGLLELMASQGVSEAQMYKTALAVNSFWFPDTYRTLARYFESKGIQWSAVNPSEVLGSAYSSAQGYGDILALVAPEPSTQSQGGCGVNSGSPAQPQRQQSGCGVQ